MSKLLLILVACCLLSQSTAAEASACRRRASPTRKHARPGISFVEVQGVVAFRAVQIAAARRFC